jgi:hypothetical protein
MQAGQQPPGQHQHQGKPPGQQQHQGKPPGQQPASKVTTKQDTLDKIISTLRSIGCYIAAFIGLFLDLILYVVAKIAQTPAFLTSTAAIIIMGPVLLYLLSLNAETYYVGMGGSPFLMKFLIDDGLILLMVIVPNYLRHFLCHWQSRQFAQLRGVIIDRSPVLKKSMTNINIIRWMTVIRMK